MDVGVDIGGTFTDVVCHEPGQPLKVLKVATTREDPGRAVLNGIDKLAEEWGIDPGALVRFVHGTTVATNAVLERKGPKTGLLTTAGFRDILEIGRQMRQEMYASVLKPEEPTFLAPGEFRQEVIERISPTGEVLCPLEEDSVRNAALDLHEKGVKSIAVCYLFSFANPAHEQRTAEIVREVCPDMAVSLSSDVDPAFREYERTVVTLFDAYIKPVISNYLSQLESGLSQAGVHAPLQLMQSRGGIASSEVARKRPVRLFLSGPAAGVEGARMVGESSDEADLISVDVGGTSSDISLIKSGKPLVRPEGLVSGYTIRVPMVDVNAIGSGGGSIAWIDPAGGLRVGPESAGSEPGPACYGRGGTQATVTDASMVLGYLDPDYFAGGSFKLQPERAFEVIEKTIASPLGISVQEAALGIHRIVNTQMAEGIRLVSIRQGYDPRDFALLPLGGAGGIHACSLAEELGINRIIVAQHPGVLSAIGLLSSVVEHEVSAACSLPLDGLDTSELGRQLDVLDTECSRLMASENVGDEEIQVEYSADVCYVGQSHYLDIPFTLGPSAGAELQAGFLEAHQRVYGHATDAPMTIVNIRAIHRGGKPEVQSSDAGKGASGQSAKGTRDILIRGNSPLTATIYDRAKMRPGDSVPGPAILEQSDTTTLVNPGWTIKVLASGVIKLVRDENRGEK